MIFGGYFEEWGIRYSGYNIADLPICRQPAKIRLWPAV
jgi:hypothetical protein